MVYSWQKDLLGIPKEQILLHLYNAIINSSDNVHIDKRPSLEDAKKIVVYAMKKKKGIVSDFLDEKINVNFSGKEFDFSNFEKEYGPFVLHEAITNCQISGIEQNNYLNNLEQEVQGFNMCGKYIKYYNAKDPIYNGIYFVCGYDEDAVSNKKIDIENIVKTQYGTKSLRLDIHAEKLTEGAPYAIHQKIVHYCLNASTIRTLGNKFQLKNRINACSTWFVKNVTMLCRNAISKKLSNVDKLINKNALENFFPEQAKDELKTKGEGNPLDYIMHTNPERISIFRKNMVTMEDLVKKTFNLTSAKFVKPKDKYKNSNFVPVNKLIYETGCVCGITVPNSISSRLQNIMINECPEILFSQVSSNNNTTTFLYDSKYQPKLQQCYLIASKPHIFNREFQFEDLTSQYNNICIRGIHKNDLDKVFEEADKIGLKACVNIDTYYYAHSCSAKDFSDGNFIYPVAFPENHEKPFKDITNKLGIDVCYEPKMNEEKIHCLTSFYPTLDTIDDFKKWLSKHPEMLYYQSKAIATELTGLAARTGYGSPEKNSFSSVCMVLDGYYKDEIEFNVMKLKNPEYFKYSIDDIRKIGAEDVKQGKSTGLGTSSFGCTTSDFKRLFETTQYYNIPMCINEQKLLYNKIDDRSDITNRIYTLTFPSTYFSQINSFLEQLSKADSKHRLLPYDDLEKYNCNFSPVTSDQATMDKMGEECFRKALEENDR
jgi:hypothetical protein